MFLPDFLKRDPFNVIDEPASSDLPDYVEIKRSPRAKRISLRLDTKKRCFVLVVPKRTSLKRAERFAHKHQSWMEKRLRDLPDLVRLHDGHKLDLCGQTHKIAIDYDVSYKRTDIQLRENTLHVRTNKEDPHNRIVRFLKKHAKEKLRALSEQKAKEIGQSVQSVTVRDTKSRWGSCSHEGKLSYSWRLIFAPYAAMDYVVAHEVAHLQHMDHSADFWALCEELSEDYRKGKSWMRTHAQDLMKYQ